MQIYCRNLLLQNVEIYNSKLNIIYLYSLNSSDLRTKYRTFIYLTF